MTERRRFAQVGMGGRGEMYYTALARDYRRHCELVALCDLNPGRLALAAKRAKELGVAVSTYPADQFDRMLRETRADTVIVTTKDCFHDEYMVRAMKAGCDVITEKPMTIDDKKCRRILRTQKETGRRVRVTFNYRYSPVRTQVKQLLMSGVIGNVLSVDFHWNLDTSHGADYFRRWHRNKANSGGLIVHKATHHFDLVNWWLSTVPEKVYAMGKRKFYTPQTAERYGLVRRAERCTGCPESKKCPFYLDMTNGSLRELYRDNEKYDGYFRDRCVFSEKIDIEDSMNVAVKYANGALMSYSLNAFLPWEGYAISFNGTKGRLEHKCMETVYINADGSVPGELIDSGTTLRVFPHFRPAHALDIHKSKGGHGGGDEPMLDDLFSVKPRKDLYLRAADQRSGAWSILTGIAANRSMKSGKAVEIARLAPGLEMPDYPPMPATDSPLPVRPRKK